MTGCECNQDFKKACNKDFKKAAKKELRIAIYLLQNTFLFPLFPRHDSAVRRLCHGWGCASCCAGCPGSIVDRLQSEHSQAFEVQATLASSRCIACKRSDSTTCFYSQAGRTEYDRTGVCESCWDCMFDPANGRQEQLQECDKLSTTGVNK